MSLDPWGIMLQIEPDVFPEGEEIGREYTLDGEPCKWIDLWRINKFGLPELKPGAHVPMPPVKPPREPRK